MSTVIDQLKKAKAAAVNMSGLEDKKREKALKALAAALRSESAAILAENAKDCAAMPKEDPRYDRLLLNAARLDAIAADVEKVAAMPSPIGRVISERTVPNGLNIRQLCVPLGVVGVIYESRPNVTVDVFALCFKTGNAAVLKGGKEAQHTNSAFAGTITRTLREQGIDENALCLLPPDRAAADEMLAARGLVDVCIPRGSRALIDHVAQTAKIPVIETGAGIVHVYIDKSADLAKARDIIFNSKTRRVSVCNALDCLLVHADRLGDLPALLAPLAGKNVEIFADDLSFGKLAFDYPQNLVMPAQPDDYGREFLDYKMAVKTVHSLREAVDHIGQYTTGHSEAIVAEDTGAIETFLQQVDSAAVYANASTAFTDGGEFGMGAEIGISTQKLHARGPMALDALTSYKWVIHGTGQTRPA